MLWGFSCKVFQEFRHYSTLYCYIRHLLGLYTFRDIRDFTIFTIIYCVMEFVPIVIDITVISDTFYFLLMTVILMFEFKSIEGYEKRM